MTHFRCKPARDAVDGLTRLFDEPTYVGEGVVGWEKPYGPYIEVYVKDEYIYHDFPREHHDFVYSTAKIPLEAEIACRLLRVSGSIIIDLLKGEVTARCGGLKANDVTLSFVEDVSEGLAEPTKEEYARRITSGRVSRAKYDSHLKMGNTDDDICSIM